MAVPLRRNLEEWEKVDVGEVHAPGNLPSPPTTSENEKWLLKTFNTPPRERHTVMCVTVLRHREKVPLTRHHGSIMVLERTTYLGDSRSSGVPHHNNSSLPKSSWKAVGDASWDSVKVQPSLKTRSFHFIHPKQYGAFPRGIVLPYPHSEILSV